MARLMDPKLKKVLLDMLCETPPLPFTFDTISSSDSDSSESEEEEHRIVQTKNFVDEPMLNYGSATFNSHFRMSQDTAYMLIGNYGSSSSFPMGNSGVEKVSAEKTVLLTLWYLVNAECFRLVSERFDISYSSAHRCMMRFVKFIISTKEDYLKWPSSEEKQQIATQFANDYGLTNVIGMIDACYIKIAKPKQEPKSYVNSYGYHSLILQVVCRENKSFIDVCCEEPGSSSDAHALERSALFSKVSEDDASYFEGKYSLIGDLAYPNLDWLVVPFNTYEHLTEQQNDFNDKLYSTQIEMENAFGLLKNRFKRLEYVPNLDLSICTQIITVCCILHNICIANDDCNFDIKSEAADLDISEAVLTISTQQEPAQIVLVDGLLEEYNKYEQL